MIENIFIFFNSIFITFFIMVLYGKIIEYKYTYMLFSLHFFIINTILIFLIFKQFIQ